MKTQAKPFQVWLWPDRTISKSESRRLREEHNALLNSQAELLEACKCLLETYASMAETTAQREGENALHSSVRRARAAIAKATS